MYGYKSYAPLNLTEREKKLDEIKIDNDNYQAKQNELKNQVEELEIKIKVLTEDTESNSNQINDQQNKYVELNGTLFGDPVNEGENAGYISSIRLRLDEINDELESIKIGIQQQYDYFFKLIEKYMNKSGTDSKTIDTINIRLDKLEKQNPKVTISSQHKTPPITSFDKAKK